MRGCIETVPWHQTEAGYASDTIGQSFFVNFETRMSRPLTEALRLVSNVQLVKRLFTVKRKANTALPCLFNSNS